MKNLRTKQMKKEKKRQKGRLKYREQTGSYQRGGGWEIGEKGEG